MSVQGGTDISGASTAGGGGNYQGGYSSGSGGNRLYLSVQGPDINQLQQYVLQLVDNVKTIPGMVDIGSNYEATQQES